jgi:hypothetical protein
MGITLRRSFGEFWLLGITTIFLGACSTLTPAQDSRNAELWEVARGCQYGTVRVDRISNDGIPHTTTFNSGGSDFAVFRECYISKATPIWRSYCAQEPQSPQCGTQGSVVTRTSAVPSEADRLDRMFRSQVQNDVELSTLVKSIPIGPRDYEETIIVDGNAWRKLTPLERERVLTKIGTHMRESLRAAKPLPSPHKFSATVYDEVLVRFGSILIRGPNDEMSYTLEK